MSEPTKQELPPQEPILEIARKYPRLDAHVGSGPIQRHEFLDFCDEYRRFLEQDIRKAALGEAAQSGPMLLVKIRNIAIEQTPPRILRLQHEALSRELAAHC